MKSIIYYLDHFTPEFLIIEGAFLILIFVAIIVTWMYNRKKYQALAHQIPAGVVKNYLDSVIQNSSALKSSLFRGGGLDLEGIPSVMPVSDLGSGGASANPEELNRLQAEINSLRSQMGEKDGQIKDLEDKLANASSGGGEVDDSAFKAEIDQLKTDKQKLEEELEAAKKAAESAGEGGGGGGGDEALQSQLEEITKERDELKEKLQEYEIIEDDLANLKKLQQENEQLRKSLEGGGGAPPAAEAAAEPAAEEAPAEEEAAAEPPAEEGPAAEAPPEKTAEEQAQADSAADEAAADAAADGTDVPQPEGEEKSAEDLLNEFEKMLG